MKPTRYLVIDAIVKLHSNGPLMVVTVDPTEQSAQDSKKLIEEACKKQKFNLILLGNHGEVGIGFAQAIPKEALPDVVVLSSHQLEDDKVKQYETLGISRFCKRGQSLGKLLADFSQTRD